MPFFSAGSGSDSCTADSDCCSDSGFCSDSGCCSGSADSDSCSDYSYINPPLFIRGDSAFIGCPLFQDLSLGLKIRLTTNPETIATVIPPAADFKPPVIIPRKPSSAIASFTPFAKI